MQLYYCVQSVQGHTGLTLLDWALECPNVKNIKKGGLDPYGAERFGRFILPQSEKVWDLKV